MSNMVKNKESDKYEVSDFEEPTQPPFAVIDENGNIIEENIETKHDALECRVQNFTCTVHPEFPIVVNQEDVN